MSTHSQIKDVGYARWIDHRAALEPMRGKAWKAALRKQAHIFNKVASLPAIRKYSKQFSMIGEAAVQAMGLKNIFGATERLPPYLPNWLRVQDPNFYICRNGDSNNIEGVLVTYGEKQGSNFYILSYFPINRQKPAWTIQHTGADIFVKNGRCYYIEADPITNRDYKLMSCCAKTGKERQELFTEKDPRKLLLLYPCENKELFFQVEDSGITALYYVNCSATGSATGSTTGSAHVQLCDNKSTTQIPCGFLEKPVWISYNTTNNKPTLHNCNYKLPSDDLIIYWGAINRGWLLGHAYGNATLYRWTTDECKSVYSIKAGHLLVDSKTEYYHHNRPLLIAAKSVSGGLEKLELAEGVLTKKQLLANSFADKYIATECRAHSFDGTQVPYHLVKARRAQKKPVALLVYGYGSYGYMTQIHKCIEEFAPLLDIGWAIAFAYIRGGGDSGAAWAAGGRLYNRVRSIEDFEAVILSARGSTGVSAESTVISGRSAGGMLVGSVAARNSGGVLFKGVWAEEPFVDVVTSMANKAYPHTTPEQNEFGDPQRSVADFMTALKFSPYHSVGCGAAQLFVLARTGENDSQVLAYEPLKWIEELQAADKGNASAAPKLYAFGANQGHHYTEVADLKARSTDMALLHCWATEPTVRQKILAIGNNKNRDTTRKFEGTRKANHKRTHKSKRA